MTEAEDRVFAADIERLAPSLPHYFGSLCADGNAEDLTQDVLLLAWRFRAKWEHRCALKTWLYNIARNQAASLKRKANAQMRPVLLFMEISESQHPADKRAGPDRCTDRIDITRAMTRLTAKEREAVAWYLAGESNPPVPSTGKVRLHRGIMKLRKVLNPKIRGCPGIAGPLAIRHRAS
jgi:DNA-directed RNA polymerase specialized sigma24 family protein